MTKKSDATAKQTLDAMNAGHVDPSPQPVWVVLQFGRDRRPNVACSTQLDLAVASFLQSAYITAALFPEEQFTIVGEDDDAALQGLSLYLGGVLILALQPAAGIVRHPVHPVIPGLPAQTFSASAPLLLAALAKRKKVSDREVEKLLHSRIAYSWFRDIQPARQRVITEQDAATRTTTHQADAIWRAMAGAHVMEELTATLG